MKKNNQSNLAIFAILTTLTLLTWIAVEAYLRFYKIEVGIVPQNIVSAFNPTLNTQVLDNLEQRIFITPDQVSGFRPKSAIAPQTATEEPEISVSGRRGVISVA